MPSIGDRLEEARKRQGISIREASEATKIRGDLLLSLENNNFDFDLPDVYKRGFLKLYGKYLKLDTDKLMADFEAAMMGRSKVKRSDAREFFGRMDLPERTTPLGSSESTPPFGEHEHEEPHPRKSESAGEPADAMEQVSDTTLYWKIGGIFVIVTVIFALLAMLVINIFSGDSESEDAIASDTSGEVVNEDPTADLPPVPSEITIVGLGNTQLLIKDVNSNEIIQGAPRSIEAGREISFMREGPVRIAAAQIENIAVKIGDRTFRVDDLTGPRSWYFNDEGPYTPGQ